MCDTGWCVLEALDKLAAEGSPRQVAARLELDCCIGLRRSYTTCPVAEWVLATTGHRVDVGPDWWCTRNDDSVGGYLPPIVEAFISGFDLQHYPLLDDVAAC